MALNQFWEREIPDDERDKIFDDLAKWVVDRRLEVPAVMGLEMHRPLCNVVAHAAIGFSGFIAPFVGFNRLDELSYLLSKSENVELLITRIEDRAEARGQGT